MTPEMARAYIQENLKALQMDYVDLLLMHLPMDELAPYPYNATKETADVSKRMGALPGSMGLDQVPAALGRPMSVG